MSLAKLTSISTKTLSLLLERQRLQTLPSFKAPNSVTGPLSLDDDDSATSNPLHLPQIKKNLAQLRHGIAEMEAKEDGLSEAASLLKNQYERMRAMLGSDAAGIPALDEPTPRPQASQSIAASSPSPQPSSAYATPLAASPAPMPSTGLTASRGVSKYDSARFLSATSAAPSPSSAPLSTSSSSSTPKASNAHKRLDSNTVFIPYTDDPSGKPSPLGVPPHGTGEEDTGILLQTQRFIMSEQDQRLDELSHSINRQHHISLQINDEMDVHMGLLGDLERGVDGTSERLGSARRKLDRVARGIKENSSVFAIGLLIFVLLVLIIVLKT